MAKRKFHHDRASSSSSSSSTTTTTTTSTTNNNGNNNMEIEIIKAYNGMAACNGFNDNAPCICRLSPAGVAVSVIGFRNRRNYYHPAHSFNVGIYKLKATKKSCNCKAKNLPNHINCHSHCRNCGKIFNLGEMRIRIGGKWCCISCIMHIKNMQLLAIKGGDIGGFDNLREENKVIIRNIFGFHSINDNHMSVLKSRSNTQKGYQNQKRRRINKEQNCGRCGHKGVYGDECGGCVYCRDWD